MLSFTIIVLTQTVMGVAPKIQAKPDFLLILKNIQWKDLAPVMGLSTGNAWIAINCRYGKTIHRVYIQTIQGCHS